MDRYYFLWSRRTSFANLFPRPDDMTEEEKRESDLRLQALRDRREQENIVEMQRRNRLHAIGLLPSPRILQPVTMDPARALEELQQSNLSPPLNLGALHPPHHLGAVPPYHLGAFNIGIFEGASTDLPKPMELAVVDTSLREWHCPGYKVISMKRFRTKRRTPPNVFRTHIYKCKPYGINNRRIIETRDVNGETKLHNITVIRFF